MYFSTKNRREDAQAHQKLILAHSTGATGPRVLCVLVGCIVPDQAAGAWLLAGGLIYQPSTQWICSGHIISRLELLKIKYTPSYLAVFWSHQPLFVQVLSTGVNVLFPLQMRKRYIFMPIRNGYTAAIAGTTTVISLLHSFGYTPQNMGHRSSLYYVMFPVSYGSAKLSWVERRLRVTNASKQQGVMSFWCHKNHCDWISSVSCTIILQLHQPGPGPSWDK